MASEGPETEAAKPEPAREKLQPRKIMFTARDITAFAKTRPCPLFSLVGPPSQPQQTMTNQPQAARLAQSARTNFGLRFDDVSAGAVCLRQHQATVQLDAAAHQTP